MAEKPYVVQAYRVDFKFTTEDQASMHVIAQNAEDAAAGCMYILSRSSVKYDTPEVVNVEVYTEPTTQETAKFN